MEQRCFTHCGTRCTSTSTASAPPSSGPRTRRRQARPRPGGSRRVSGKGETMQYMLIYAGAPDLDEAWDDEAWAALTSWLDEAIASGVSIEGGPLRLDADA